MRRVLFTCLGLLSVAATVPIAGAVPAAAQNAREYQYRKSVPSMCPRGLKEAAGACVRRCPNGYRDMGRRCQLKNMSR